jgi:hypothetical protein
LKKQSQQRSSKHTDVGKRTTDTHTKWERFRVPPAILQTIAYCIIAIAVVLSWFMTPIPVAVGFTILAVIRIGIAVREARREAANLEAAEQCDKSGICSA